MCHRGDHISPPYLLVFINDITTSMPRPVFNTLHTGDSVTTVWSSGADTAITINDIVPRGHCLGMPVNGQISGLSHSARPRKSQNDSLHCIS